MNINITETLKLQHPLGDMSTVVRDYRDHVGYMIEEIQDHLYHDRHRQAIASISELRAVIRTGFFLDIVQVDCYGAIMDYLYMLKEDVNNEKI